VLTVAQLEALGYVRDLARRDPAADQRAAAVLARAAIETEVSELCSRVAMAGRVALNFHPDRIAADGRMVVEGLLSDGVYRSQFETGISNGGLGAVRESFEARLFAGVYARFEVSPAERPRYGGLDLVGHPDGPCPGSAPVTNVCGRRCSTVARSASVTASPSRLPWAPWTPSSRCSPPS
jgi:hypothetical protein